MIHRRTRPSGSPPAASQERRPQQLALDALGLVAVGRIDGDVERGGAVERGGDEGAADQAGVVVGQHDLGAVSARGPARAAAIRWGSARAG